jgi:hypothetical protein
VAGRTKDASAPPALARTSPPIRAFPSRARDGGGESREIAPLPALAANTPVFPRFPRMTGRVREAKLGNVGSDGKSFGPSSCPAFPITGRQGCRRGMWGMSGMFLAGVRQQGSFVAERSSIQNR